jgi:hypothetical protein
MVTGPTIAADAAAMPKAAITAIAIKKSFVFMAYHVNAISYIRIPFN